MVAFCHPSSRDDMHLWESLMVFRDRAIYVYLIYAGYLQHRADIEERVSVMLPQ
jgi:hypothetical protein